MDNGLGKPINLLFNKVYGNGIMPLKKRENLIISNSQENSSANKTQEKQVLILPQEEDRFSKILKSFNLPVKEDFLQALKTLDLHGIHLSKENLIQYTTTKNQLKEVVEGMDYDTALQLIEKDVDLEKDSLQEVVDQLEEVKNEEKGFSLVKLFKGFKSMSTEEAETIALKLYGNTQGKDITDIIKALDRAGMDISKANINRVNEIFNKLHNIKDYDDEGLVAAVKNKIDTNIDYLYKLKSSIKKGAIAIEEKFSHFASKAYEGFNARVTTPSERELRLLEEDIRGLLREEGLSVTKDEVALSKVLIKQEMAVSKENIEKIHQLKETIKELVATLDKEKISLLLKSGLEIEKETITQLLKAVRQLESIENQQPLMETTPKVEEDKIKDIMGKIKNLGEIKEEELLTLLKKGADFKISDLQKVKVSPGRELILEDKTNEVYHSTLKMVGIFNQISRVDIDTIANHLKSNLPMTLESLAIDQPLSNGRDSIAQMLGFKSTQQTNEIQQAFKNLNFIRTNLSASMVTTGVEGGLQLEKMELGKLTNYINECQMNNGNWELVNALPSIQQQGENLLALLMKNNMALNLGEMKQMAHFMKNQQQVGHQLQELFEILEKESKASLKSEMTELKELVKGLTGELKNGRVNLQRFHEDLSKIVRELAGKGNLMEEKTRDQLFKGLNKLSETVETQNQLNQKDTVVQMPFMMDNQVKNLQIYVMKEKQGSKKIDPKNMSVLLNMDTNNMGNINIYLGVNHKQLVLKVGVSHRENQVLLESHVSNLKEMLGKLGYEIKDISFRVDEDQHLMSLVDEVVEKQKTVKHCIDITI